MNDSLDLGKIVPLKGTIKIEMFDAITQKKLDEMEVENFITLGGYDYLRRLQRFFIQYGCTNYSGEYQGVASEQIFPYNSLSGFFKYLLLTADDRPENPNFDSSIDYEIIGWGPKVQYTGADLKGGTLNIALSHATEDYALFVWDFANDRANGTFRTVALAEHAQRHTLSLPRTLHVGQTTRSYMYIAEGGGYFWGNIGSNLIWAIDKTTMQEVAQYTLAHAPQTITYDSGYIYYTTSNTIYRYRIATGVTDPAVNAAFMPSNYIVIVDGWLYLFSATQVQRFPVSNFVTVAGQTRAFAGAVIPSNFNYFFKYNGDVYAFASKGTAPIFMDGAMKCFRLNFGSSNAEWIYVDEVKWRPDFSRLFTDEAGTQIFGLRNTGGAEPAGPPVRVQGLKRVPAFITPGMGPYLTRKLLPSPVTKSSAKSMRITYRIDMS